MSLSDFSANIIQSIRSTSVVEAIAIITALVYVVLATLENSWCWIFGIVSAALYIKINYDAKIYLESWLSLYYVVIGIYGWYVWIIGKTKKDSGAVLHRIKTFHLILSIATGIAGTIILGMLSDRFTDSPIPYFDGALASFSLVATFLTTRKILENWIFWIIIDAAYVIIYIMRSLPSTSILFLIYTFIAVFGFIKWRKNLKASIA
ncbi:MAG TPA: nicotinamide riboside transporter PnuC [Bacteroidia bacterium]|nr:nicotinamide riboside transporter PnuC [Bacteroidia bacterium]